jgi:methionyl-tRNA formyltransferase
MRIVFMGTPDFALPALRAVLAARHEIVAVFTQMPRAAGRGLGLRKSPVQIAAEQAGLKVLTPERLKDATEQERFRALRADAAVVVAYGVILPKPILEGTKHGAFNIHASLLPRWRGAAPIQRAIMAGDIETGVSIMRLEQGLDTGPVCLARHQPIGPDMTAGELHDELALLGAHLMVEALGELERGKLDCKEQPSEGVTYAEKISASETRIDWKRPAPEVHNFIRGLSPYPGAWFEVTLGGRPERIRALRSKLVEISGTAGTVLDEHLTIACGEGAVRVTEVQRAGKRPMSADDFLRGVKLAPGTIVA